jgi:hypothetical protein
MVKYNGKRGDTRTARWEIAPTYSDKLEGNKKWSRNYGSIVSKDGLSQVTSGMENMYDVHLIARSCGCNKWDITRIPCHHVI